MLRWRAQFFDVDLGTLEIVSVMDVIDEVLSPEPQVTGVSAL